MKNTFIYLLIMAFSITSHLAFGLLKQNSEPITNGEYTAVIDGYDWGAAVSKVILSMQGTAIVPSIQDFEVNVIRTSECDQNLPNAKGTRTILFSYTSDENGKRIEKGKYITLVLAVGPDLGIGSPLQYFRNESCRGNKWVDYGITVIHRPTKARWDKEKNRISSILDKFDLSESFAYKNNIKLTYAAYAPEIKNQKAPLIIWLHGGGEGGTDPSIPLLANKATNYASKEIQEIFNGAYVLVPQCPGAWMHNANGVSSHGSENDIYNEGLMALIKDYVSKIPTINKDRIYIGGCSNGGYMALKLMLLYPDYFAAGYISSLAYQSQFITDNEIKSIANKPIWFVHSADDKTTLPDRTVIPVYKRLIAAGATDVHLSYFDHVVDITGFFGGENYYYNGHHSWIYSHANVCTKDFDGTPVRVEGNPVTILEWVSKQSN